MNEEMDFKKYVYKTISDNIGELTTNRIDESEAFKMFIKKLYEYEHSEDIEKVIPFKF